jgi:hypothetical protein
MAGKSRAEGVRGDLRSLSTPSSPMIIAELGSGVPGVPGEERGEEKASVPPNSDQSIASDEPASVAPIPGCASFLTSPLSQVY